MSASNRFFWYELMTTDVEAAKSFYTGVVGWTATVWGEVAEGSPYIIMNAGDRGIGGIMRLPEAVKQMGGGPAWVGYIHVADADAKAAEIKAAGGQVYREPSDIPGVGRFSVVTDPQGAVFMLLTPQGQGLPPAPRMTTGHVGWHELCAADWQGALAFYASQFGWTATTSVDMRDMGTYQIFSMGNGDEGGMMNKMPDMPTPFWTFYFVVEGIEAASERVKQGGGNVVFGPMQVPDASWILHARDPQGAPFALVSPTQ